ncbi:MAG TPA: serine/threonine protein kinase [Gammaproteobacteria bacterium]|nr:serine/threonine protein kinase [Gammaproteobacteria bacterium]
MEDTAATASAPYAGLTPDAILDAVDKAGHRSDGTLLALNSYENRVYQVGVEGGAPLIAKFYRPGRWTDAAILEEHGFALELAAQEIPVVPPLETAKGETLLHHAGYRYALFRRQGGRAPDLESEDHLEWLGRFMGRIHAVGRAKPFHHRHVIDLETYGRVPRDWLLETPYIPSELRPRYKEVTDLLLAGIARCYERAGDVATLRIHGDCHPGNLLWTDDGPHFVDFDDCGSGPAVQDLWMLLSGERHEMELQLAAVLEGYNQFADFDPSELWLVEPLRTLRMIHYAAWIARRWDDPAFPRAFPWFDGPRYWEEHLQALREQVPLLDEEPLQLDAGNR